MLEREKRDSGNWAFKDPEAEKKCVWYDPDDWGFIYLTIRQKRTSWSKMKKAFKILRFFPTVIYGGLLVLFIIGVVIAVRVYGLLTHLEVWENIANDAISIYKQAE